MTANDHVAAYYDNNTLSFLRFGGAGETAAIHRKIWAPGVTTEARAFEYLNEIVAAEAIPTSLITADAPVHLLDLGCGVGGTATWLAERMPVEVLGVTNSRVQVSLAEERAGALGMDSRCRFRLADFADLPQLGMFHGAYAIESFIHASDPARFFTNASRHLVPGGRLVICDDFLAESALQLPPKDPAWRHIGRFTDGWQADNLDTATCAADVAYTCGLRLVEVRDLTAYQRHFHPLVLRLLYATTGLPLGWSYWQNLAGGSALQVCTQRGWIRYLVLVFEKEG
jgi:SAM-dependent methyltransferase